ncbi:hypothetical protein P8452_58702 [Trifolium repens]|nr:hypothetical protein QL285_096706 [Trifolium repens]WJX75142.1 hypothetical protein P8452_58702 [Trifolium repens]
MRSNKQLRELVHSITDFESRERHSTKPFTPHFMDVIVSKDLPQLYSQQELNQIQNLSSICNKNIKEEEEEEEKEKKEIDVTPEKKKPRTRLSFKPGKGSMSKEASESKRVATLPFPRSLSPPRSVVLALRVDSIKD